MSLLDTGNETILVYPQEQTTDDRGNTVWRPSTTPVRVRCRIQPEDADEPAVAGQATVTTYRVIARDAPIGPWARVEWNGRTWDVVGEPRRYNGSPATRHIDALIRARASERVPIPVNPTHDGRDGPRAQCERQPRHLSENGA